MNITTKHKSVLDMSERWEMARAAAEGEHAVHEKGEVFLPRLQDEDDQAYRAPHRHPFLQCFMEDNQRTARHDVPQVTHH